MPLPISKRRLLVVEGKDEVHFFDALLAKLEMTDVQVLDTEGKNNFPVEFAALLLSPGFDQLAAYAIVRDADTGREGAFQSIRNILRKHSQPHPDQPNSFSSNEHPRVGIYILPGEADTGMLEDLCLQTVVGHPVTACVDAYMACLEEQLPQMQSGSPNTEGPHFPKNIAKARALAFLAGMHEPVHQVGFAALRGCWDLDHECLNELKRFLTSMTASETAP